MSFRGRGGGRGRGGRGGGRGGRGGGRGGRSFDMGPPSTGKYILFLIVSTSDILNSNLLYLIFSFPSSNNYSHSTWNFFTCL